VELMWQDGLFRARVIGAFRLGARGRTRFPGRVLHDWLIAREGRAAVPGAVAVMPRRGVSGCCTLRPVSSDLWVGAVATLAGATLGGASTYLVSRLQIRESRVQRVDAERWERARRNVDRRFDAYANFLTCARTYRNAIRPYRSESGPGMSIQEIDAAAREATSAASLVFLVYGNPATEVACRGVLRTIRDTVNVIHEGAQDPDGVPWQQLNHDMARILRDFQDAARAELEVNGDSAERPAD
jgi:hypothetical protein